MRTLWLDANLLLPLDKGGKLRTWHLMRHLAKRHEITYLSFTTPDDGEDDRAGMSAVCAHLVTVPRVEHPKGTARFYAEAAAHVCSRVPYAVAKYRSAAFERVLRELLARTRFDRLVCDFLVPAINMPAHLPCPSVIFTHNVEAEIWRRHMEASTHPIARRLYRQQWRRMLRFEGDTLARFERVLAVSDTDRDTFRRLYPGKIRGAVSVIPTGVDTAYFSPASADAPALPHIVFVGSMDWLPNVDAMTHFCEAVMPRVAAQIPGVTLSIVGRAPAPAVRRLARPGSIEVTGRVDDVRPALARAAVVVVPLRIGGGTRLKIFEAMAAGKAVVSTTIGAEGLPAEPGRHLLIADTPDGFADQVVSLLRNPERRRSIGEAARRFVADHFDWAAVAGTLEQAIDDTGPLSGHVSRAKSRAAESPVGAS